MVFKGYKHPLVQEDMWEINDEDSTAYMTRYFEGHMKSELGKARVRFQKKLKKKLVKKVMKGEASQNGFSESLRKGVSQDVLVMVREPSNTFTSLFLSISHTCS